jgi:hypothetical protein
MASKIPVFSSLPDPIRSAIGARRSRRWVKALRFAALHNRSLGTSAPHVSFYPMRPGPKSSLGHILPRVGAKIAHSARTDGVLFAWDTGTFFRPHALRELPAHALNRYCLDISKSNVDRVWQLAAGYSISVDPLATEGALVEKPEINGLHGGRVVNGPLLESRRGMVYQKLVDARVDERRILQLRPVIIGGRIVLTYAKWREYPHWFKGTELTVPTSSDDLLSQNEQHLLERFARLIGLDYGELDVLRDRQSGLIYVVDANRTPVRPKGLPIESEDAAFGPQAEAIRELIRGGALP